MNTPMHLFTKRSRRRAHARGLTLIEVMITIAVLAILASVAAPSLRDFMADYRSKTTMTQLVTDLSFAKLEAIKRNARVVLCPQAAQASAPCSSTNWANGWVVCYDRDGDGACDATSTADPNPMKISSAIDANLALTNPAGFVVFTPTGASTAQVVFTLTGSNTATRTGTVAATGVITSKKN